MRYELRSSVGADGTSPRLRESSSERPQERERASSADYVFTLNALARSAYTLTLKYPRELVVVCQRTRSAIDKPIYNSFCQPWVIEDPAANHEASIKELSR